MCKVKNKTGGDEKVSRLCDSYSNFAYDNNSEKLENLEKSRFHSADITTNIDKWGMDIPFEMINSDVN